MTVYAPNAVKEFRFARAKHMAKGDKRLLTSIRRAQVVATRDPVHHNQIRVKLVTSWAKQVIGAAVQREKNGTSYDPKS